MTVQRRLIHDILRAKGHMTADEVFGEARRRMPSIALATVYRNLNQMAKDGTILRVSVNGEPDRFDRTAGEHDHMVCIACGSMFDANVGDLRPMLEERLQTPIVRYALDIRIICPQCRERAHKNDLSKANS